MLCDGGKKLGLSEGLIILISVIVAGMVPGGFMMHGRLSAIEVAVKETAQLRDQISNLTRAVQTIEVRLAKMENGNRNS